MPDADAADGPPRFLLDVMLGKLATFLRMCGVDAVYALDRGLEDDDAILDLARDEDRTLVTRDRQLAARAEDAVRLTAHDSLEQLEELQAAGYTLSMDGPPSRCGRCNGRLRALDDESARPDDAPSDATVYRCVDCGQHFWRGSHWRDLAERLAE